MNVPPMETELKLDVAGGGVSAVQGWLDASIGPAGKQHRLVSTYFDTIGEHLWKAGVTVRVRRDGKRRVQTIKAEKGRAAGLFSRPEWERDISGDMPDLDPSTEALLSKLAGAPVTGNALVARFKTDVGRRLWRVKRNGADLEIASDEGVISANDRTISIHELEIELKCGPKTAMFDLAAEIVAAFPLRVGVQSKAERGHALGGGRNSGEALAAEPFGLADDLTAAMGFQAISYACLRRYRLSEAWLLKAPRPENLHQCRVALRRLRSAMALFKPLLGDQESKAVHERLRKAAGLFSNGRNIDVLISQVADADVVAKLVERREKIYAKLLNGLQSAEFRSLQLQLTAWISTGDWLSEPDTEADRSWPIQRFAVHTLRRYRRRLKRRGKHLARLNAEHRHAVRITANKLRYAAEFFGSLFPGKEASRRRDQFLQALDSLQSELGRLNDEATGAKLLERFGIGADTPSGPILRHNSRAIARATKAYDALVDCKPFWV